MKKGYDVFGKAYGVMLRNDLHDSHSVDHQLLRNMILLEPDSYSFFYQSKPACPDMRSHELYDFAQSLKGREDSVSIRNVLDFTWQMAENFPLSFEEMQFGGTEKQILDRGTNWCTDMARVAVVLLNCLAIPARLLYLANAEKAYHGHAVVEAFYHGKYGVADPIHGYLFHEETPLDAFALMKNPAHLRGYDEAYTTLFRHVAISNYDPMSKENVYSVSKVNDYYRRLLSTAHHGKWFMGEDKTI